MGIKAPGHKKLHMPCILDSEITTYIGFEAHGETLKGINDSLLISGSGNDGFVRT
jgi:hypothetical protein